MDRPLKLGSRASPLALAQAREAAAAIAAANGWNVEAIEIVALTTTGDKIQDRPLAEIGGKALWTKELDRALGEGAVDACVHSLKDVESERPATLRIAAVLPRADVRDRLIGAESLDALKVGAVVGTSSPRRAAQLLRLRPDVRVVAFRGNVQTRLTKVEAGEVDATLLAAAGLNRLGISAGVPLPVSAILPAPGQGAIAVECRAEDAEVRAAIEAASHRDSFDCAMAERAFTATLGGTCHSPVGALAECGDGGLVLRAQILNGDGSDCIIDDARFARGDERRAAELARSMLSRAANSIRILFEDA